MCEVSENLIRSARERHGVSVRQLAATLDVSPSAVANWERAEARGVIQLNTLQRAIEAMGESVDISTRPIVYPATRLTPEATRSLSLHRRVASKLIEDPDIVLNVVPDNIAKTRAFVRGPRPNQWLDKWQDLASRRDIAGLVAAMINPSQSGIEMRQCSPFAGALTPQERHDALRAGSVNGN
jgi:transcriptional regulator with XRE-family HTH domain